jgi:prepilin-type N-terminal cleavage/methylation domain-containing protein/prepilin-type processing-associated H-X9-DG protein
MGAFRLTRPEAVRRHAVRRPIRSRPGFTLIEVLVVVALLVVLASLLLPVLGVARDAARRATCTANLRQLSQAFTQYCHDYDDTFPPGGDGVIHSMRDVDWLWFRRVQPYFRDDRILHCPADTIRNAGRTLSGGFPEAQDEPDLPALSYGVNWDLMDAATKRRPQARINALPFPAHTLLVADCSEPWAFGPVYVDAEGVRWSHIAYANGPPLPTAATAMHGGRSGMGHERHGTGSLVAFIDGHVAFVPASRFCRTLFIEPGSRREVAVQFPIISPEAVPPTAVP